MLDVWYWRGARGGMGLGLKSTDGYPPDQLGAGGIAIAGSMVLLAQAARIIPIGTAYAVWVGIGVFGAVLLESMLYGVPLTGMRVLFLGLLLFAIAGLKLTA